MSSETVLFQVEWSHKYNSADFTVYPAVDKYLTDDKRREEILEMMEKLVRRMKNNEYPFSI